MYMHGASADGNGCREWRTKATDVLHQPSGVVFCKAIFICKSYVLAIDDRNNILSMSCYLSRYETKNEDEVAISGTILGKEASKKVFNLILTYTSSKQFVGNL